MAIQHSKQALATSQMNVSIITVTFNSERTVRDTLQSVATQDYPHIQHIVIDGASADSTVDIVKADRFENRLLVSEPDNGMYDAINKGLSLATGDVVAILNSDDRYQSARSISQVVHHFQQNPAAEAVLGHIVFEDSEREICRFYSSQNFKPGKLRFGWMPSHPATFLRKSTYERLGQYKTDYKIAADYELIVRFFLRAGITYSKLDKVLVRMRMGGKSTAGIKSSIVLNREIIRSCRENGYYTNWLFLVPKVPIKLSELWKKPSSIQLQ